MASLPAARDGVNDLFGGMLLNVVDTVADSLAQLELDLGLGGRRVRDDDDVGRRRNDYGPGSNALLTGQRRIMNPGAWNVCWIRREDMAFNYELHKHRDQV